MLSRVGQLMALFLVVFGLLSHGDSFGAAEASPLHGIATVVPGDGPACGQPARLPYATGEADDLRDVLAIHVLRVLSSPRAGESFRVAPAEAAETRVTQPLDRPPRRRA